MTFLGKIHILNKDNKKGYKGMGFNIETVIDLGFTKDKEVTEDEQEEDSEESE